MVDRLLRLSLCAALLGAGAVGAQDRPQDDPAAAEEQEEQQEAAPEQAEAEQQAPSAEDAAEDGEFERFIPREQVSRDLGVSFPADI